MVKNPRSTVRQIESGKVLELFLSERHQKFLVEKKSAWVKCGDIWYKLNPNKPAPKDPKLAKIRELERQIEILKGKSSKGKVSKQSEARKKYLATLPREKILEIADRMRQGRIFKMHNQVNSSIT